MSYIQQILINSWSGILASVTGLFFVNKLSLFFRILLFQIIFGYFITYISIKVEFYNDFWSNLLMPVEVLPFFAAAQAYFKSVKSMIFLLFISSVFLIVFYLDTYFVGIKNYIYHAVILHSFLITGIYIVILYEEFRKKINHFTDIAIIVLSISIAAYHAAIIPVECYEYYLFKGLPIVNPQSFFGFYIRLMHVHYCLIAIAFFIANKSSVRILKISS